MGMLPVHQDMGSLALVYHRAGSLRISTKDLFALQTCNGTAHCHVAGYGYAIFQGLQREDGSGRSFNLTFTNERHMAFTVCVRTD